MTTYTPIVDATLAQDKPLTQSVARALRDNPIATAEGSSGAPVITGVNILDTKTAAVSASLDFTPIDGSYDYYEIEIHNLALSSTSTTLHFRVSVGGVWQTGGTAYKFSKLITDSNAATPAGEASNGAAQIELTKSGAMGNSTLNGIVRIFSPVGSGVKMFTFETVAPGGSSNYYTVVGSGVFNATSVLDGFRLLSSSGNIQSGKAVFRARRKA